jgi:DNA invertase Pin-like site-specific DNA recombinase
MVTYGYARVSTTDQDLTIQREALSKAGCTIIREEKKSGTKREGREQLDILMTFMQKGDALMVTRVDRLARSIGDLQDIVRDLKRRGIMIKATEQPIDTSSPAGKCFFDMLGVFAEFETNLRKERQMEGIAKAKIAGIYKGGKPRIDRAEVIRLKAEGFNPTQIAKQMGINRVSVYRILEDETVQPEGNGVTGD